MVARQEAKALTDKIVAAVRELLVDEGYELGRYSASYGDSYGLKLTAAPLNRNEAGVNTTSTEAVAFNRWHASYGLPAEALGREFQSNGRTFRFIGINPRAPKRPFLAVDIYSGKTFVFHDTPDVRRKLGAAA